MVMESNLYHKKRDGLVVIRNTAGYPLWHPLVGNLPAGGKKTIHLPKGTYALPMEVKVDGIYPSSKRT